MNVDVVAFEGLHERLGHAVGLRAAHRGEAGNQPQADREVDRVVGSIGAAIVGEPLDRVGSVAAPKRRSVASSIRSRIISPLMPPVLVAHQAIDFPIAGVQGEGDAYHLTVPAGDLEASPRSSAGSVGS